MDPDKSPVSPPTPLSVISPQYVYSNPLHLSFKKHRLFSDPTYHIKDSLQNHWFTVTQTMSRIELHDAYNIHLCTIKYINQIKVYYPNTKEPIFRCLDSGALTVTKWEFKGTNQVDESAFEVYVKGFRNHWLDVSIGDIKKGGCMVSRIRVGGDDVVGVEVAGGVDVAFVVCLSLAMCEYVNN